MNCIHRLPQLSLSALLLLNPLHAADKDKKPLIEPPVVVAAYDGKPVCAPKGAIILFDGSSTENWKGRVKKGDPTQDDTVKWRLDKEGFLEVVKGTGSIALRDAPLTTGHLHIEWATPSQVKGKGQGRGNSGVFIAGFPEVQVLDSWENVTYFDGQAGALYKRSEPLVMRPVLPVNGNATTSIYSELRKTQRQVSPYFTMGTSSRMPTHPMTAVRTEA